LLYIIHLQYTNTSHPSCMLCFADSAAGTQKWSYQAKQYSLLWFLLHQQMRIDWPCLLSSDANWFCKTILWAKAEWRSKASSTILCFFYYLWIKLRIDNIGWCQFFVIIIIASRCWLVFVFVFVDTNISPKNWYLFSKPECHFSITVVLSF